MASLTASVVIPAYNAGTFIGQCLEGLARQTLGSGAFEIILIDDGSTDDTTQVCETFQKKLQLENLTLMRQTNAGPAAARNQGIRKATADIVVFIDSDCVARPDWLATLIAPLKNQPFLQGVEGQTIPGPGKLSPLHHYVENRVGGQYWTCNMAYRKAALLAVGGFDEGFPLPSGEDIDIARRVKHYGDILFLPEAMVEHILLDWPLKKHYARARTFSSMIRLWRKHPGLLGPENTGFWGLVRIQLTHFIFPWIRFGGWLFKNPVIFAKLSLLYIVWISDTLLRLPVYYREAHEPLVIREPFHDTVVEK